MNYENILIITLIINDIWQGLNSRAEIPTRHAIQFALSIILEDILIYTLLSLFSWKF